MKPIETSMFTLQKLIRTIVLSLVILVGCGYGLWQARHLIAGPAITVERPPAIVQNDRIITITGSAQNAVKILLNGRPIVADPSGAFAESVVLENGAGMVSLAAYDRYGRVRHWEQPLVFIESQNFVRR